MQAKVFNPRLNDLNLDQQSTHEVMEDISLSNYSNLEQRLLDHFGSKNK